MDLEHYVELAALIQEINQREVGRDTPSFEQGLWTFPRYRTWLEKRTQWYLPGAAGAEGEKVDAGAGAGRMSAMGKPAPKPRTLPPPSPGAGGRVEIRPLEGGLGKILRKFEEG